MDTRLELDSEWFAAVKDASVQLKDKNVHYSDRSAIVNVSVPIWEKYMIAQGHHGKKFATLPADRKVHFSAFIKSRWDYRSFYIAILLQLTEDKISVN